MSVVYQSGELQETLLTRVRGNLQPIAVNGTRVTAPVQRLRLEQPSNKSLPAPDLSTSLQNEIVLSHSNVWQKSHGSEVEWSIDYGRSVHAHADTFRIQYEVHPVLDFDIAEIPVWSNEAPVASDCYWNGGEFGGTCDGNPEPSIASNAKACVETRCHPLPMGDEGIVQAAENEESAEVLFTGWKEALSKVLGLLSLPTMTPAMA